MEKPISAKMKRFWGIGEVTEGIIGQVNSLYFSFFLTDIACLSTALYGIIMMATSIIDFILAPVTGGIVSGTKPMKWGRLRSWILVCPPIIAVSLMLQYVLVSGNQVVNAIWITAFYVINLFFSNIGMTANIALVPAVSEGEDREILASNRMTGSSLGRLIGGYTQPMLLPIITAAVGITLGYPLFAFISALFLWIGYYCHFRMSKGYEVEGDEVEKDEKLSVKEILQVFKATPPLFAVMLADITSNLGGFLLPSLAVYIYTYVFEKPELLSIHLLCTGIGEALGSYCSRFVVDKLKPRKGCLLIYPCVALSMFCLRFVTNSPAAFIAVHTLGNLLLGTTQPMESLLYMDCCTYNEYKTGNDATGFIMGMLNVPIKIAIIIKSAIMTAIFTTIDYEAGMEATAEIKAGFINAYTIIPMIIPLLGFLSLLLLYKVTPEQISEMKKEIEKRKEMK